MNNINCKLVKDPKEKVTSGDINKEMVKYCKEHSVNCNDLCGICATEYILKNYNVTRKDNK